MDYTFERQIELEREASRREGYAEGHASGREEGKKAGKQDALLELVRDGLISAAEAAKRLSVNEDDIIKMMKS